MRSPSLVRRPGWASAAATEEYRESPRQGGGGSRDGDYPGGGGSNEGGDAAGEQGAHGDLVEMALGAIALRQFTPKSAGALFPPDPRMALDLEERERVVVQALGRGGSRLAEWAVVMRESTGENGFVPVQVPPINHALMTLLSR